ncbi:MAG: serine/threonine protein kinase [Deltaproteobacteria bacterium]|nr:serine/threonine protein kinase [Deltaproteobacteria bacterium]
MPSLPPPAPPVLEPGYRLDRYELLCRIGQGGMASVWLARTTNSHGEEKLVAVKTILTGTGADVELRAMLLDEARIAKAIDHPNVACTLEVGQLWDMPYLVLEYVEGDPVDQLCKTLSEEGLTVPPSIVARIIADAAAGLHAAHEVFGPDGENLGIVHRDVAPPNILVDDLGQARVIDFGVAKAAERFAPETQAGVMKGRVPFMSPEHASGGPVDRRSDIWSLGVVAYFMLAGRYPFDGANDAARLIRILGTEPADPLPDSVPEPLRDVVMRALAKDVDQRWQTAEELRGAMKTAGPISSHEEVAKFFSETLAVVQKARRALVDHALAAADQRARARELLDGPLLQTPSRSIRPPAAALLDDASVSSRGTPTRPVTMSRSQRPLVRTWGPWMVGGAIAGIVILAFAMGTMTASRSNGTSGPQEPPPKNAGAGERVDTSGPTTSGGAAPSPFASASGGLAPASPTASTSATSATSAATASPTTSSAAATSATSATITGPRSTAATATPPPWAPPKASASGSTKPPPKPPEKEDTIF